MMECENQRLKDRRICGRCRSRYNKHGNYHTVLGTPHGEPLSFLASQPSGNECIEWPYTKTGNGYGVVRFQGKLRGAHRVALILRDGIDPDDLTVAHAPIICHNPLCVNVDHLRWATMAENLADRPADGFDYHEGNGNAKLTWEKVAKIREDDRSNVDVAATLGVSAATISMIRNNKSWIV